MQTKAHAKEIEIARRSVLTQPNRRRQEAEGTFLTGLGLAKDN